jgi:hypothetical protein
MTPEKLVLVELPTVKVLAHAPDEPRVTEPAPVRDPTVSDNELRSNVAPEETDMALASARRSSDPLSLSVPTDTVVVPV